MFCLLFMACPLFGMCLFGMYLFIPFRFRRRDIGKRVISLDNIQHKMKEIERDLT